MKKDRDWKKILYDLAFAIFLLLLLAGLGLLNEDNLTGPVAGLTFNIIIFAAVIYIYLHKRLKNKK